MNRNRYDKESIKERMFRNAADFWGVRNIENFDPLVKLFIEALAGDIYRLSNEVNNIETRILERIAHLLTPDILMSVRPAHMLLYTRPVEARYILGRNAGFYYDNPVFRQKNGTGNTGFYPAGSFMLTRSCVKMLVCGKNVYTVDKTLNREILARSTVRSEIFSQNLWIGLSLDPKIETLNNISFCFDFVNAENRNDYFHLLPFTLWQHNSENLKFTHGIHTVGNEQEEGDISLFTGYDLMSLLDKSIRQAYDQRFLTLKSDMKISDMKKEPFPKELLPMFPEEIVRQTKEYLYWIKVTFPAVFHEKIMERIQVGTNIFPVANRELREQSSKSIKLPNIIPLYTGEKEYFLSVQSVTDSKNRPYRQLPYSDTETGKCGTWSIRRGGAERFDSRNAKEHIACMTDLLREEGGAFALWGRGFLEELIEGFSSRIVSLEQRMSSVEQHREIPFYLITDTGSQEDEIIHASYWVTNCELVNGMKAGTFLAPYTATFVEPDLIVSMTPCTGGKSRPDSTQTVDMYKYVLTARESIYTAEDIVNFCYSRYGDMIDSAEVKKGIRVSDKPQEGLVRTIDVFISLKKQSAKDAAGELKDSLYNALVEKSPDTYNYRIFINE